MEQNIGTYKKIESLTDIQMLRTGMPLYKYPLRGSPSTTINLGAGNHEELLILAMEQDYIVLIQSHHSSESSSLAKAYHRLIEDALWWFPVE
jgi:hypothetical protein